MPRIWLAQATRGPGGPAELLGRFDLSDSRARVAATRRGTAVLYSLFVTNNLECGVVETERGSKAVEAERGTGLAPRTAEIHQAARSMEDRQMRSGIKRSYRGFRTLIDVRRGVGSAGGSNELLDGCDSRQRGRGQARATRRGARPVSGGPPVRRDAEERSHAVVAESQRPRERDRRPGLERAQRTAAEAIRIAAETLGRRIRYDFPEPNGSRPSREHRQVQRRSAKRLRPRGHGVREGNPADAAGASRARAIRPVGTGGRGAPRALRRVLVWRWAFAALEEPSARRSTQPLRATPARAIVADRQTDLHREEPEELS